MAQWMGTVGFELEPLADHALMRIRQAERIFADETTLPKWLTPTLERIANGWPNSKIEELMPWAFKA